MNTSLQSLCISRRPPPPLSFLSLPPSPYALPVLPSHPPSIIPIASAHCWLARSREVFPPSSFLPRSILLSFPSSHSNQLLFCPPLPLPPLHSLPSPPPVMANHPSRTSIIITEEQRAAKESSSRRPKETGLGWKMPRDRYDLILSILNTWEELFPAEHCVLGMPTSGMASTNYHARERIPWRLRMPPGRKDYIRCR